jgi:mono/diheme cytochrome c family protein
MRLSSASLWLALLLLSPAAGASEVERGRLLYENHCLGCHESVLHVRAQRRVRSAPELRAEVATRAKSTGLHWSAEDIDDVARYLDRRYYRLGERS